MSTQGYEEELRSELSYVAGLYARLDAERARVKGQYNAALRGTGGTPMERDVQVRTLAREAKRLDLADNGLCFGRLDTLSENMRRRRQFHTRGRQVVDFTDEVLGRSDGNVRGGRGDSALPAAVNAPRGDGMRDIVATIQAEQDEIIRLDHPAVNYRTPAEIMTVAAALLAEFAPGVQPPESVRACGVQPWSRRVTEDELPAAIKEFVRNEAGRDGTSVVIGPPGVPGAVPASETKGLEFDAVLIVEPMRILADGPRGAAELYVALTRATQRLGVLHQDPLPRALTDLAETGADRGRRPWPRPGP